MFNRRLLTTTSIIVLLLSLTIVTNSAYAGKSHMYGGASFGVGSASSYDDLPTTTIYLGADLQGFYGNRFPNMAAEVALVDLGDFSHGNGMDDIALDVSLLGFKRVGDSTEIFIKGGFHKWNRDRDYVEGEESTSYLIGFGVNSTFGQTLGARLEWVGYFSTEDDVEDLGILNLGLYTNF